MDRDLLIEIGTEEIPAVELDDAIGNFSRALEDILIKNDFRFQKIRKFSTPRRLAVIVYKLKERQEDKEIEIKGPPLNTAIKDGKLTEQGEKFLKSKGIEDYFTKKTDKGEFLFGKKILKGKTIDEFLKENFSGIVKDLGFRKVMRWDDSNVYFSRPVRWILCIYGERIIDIKIGNVISSNFTYGHRFLSKGRIYINSPEEYEKILEENYVIPDSDKRKKIILNLVKEAGKKINGEPLLKEDLLEEVKNLVEYPQIIIGEIDKNFLNLPKDVIEVAMESHQRYFPVEKDGRILPYFISVINTIPTEEIRRNNENVLIARLEDAKFYYDEDRKTNFRERFNMLEGITYQEGFGSVREKVERIIEMLNILNRKINFDKDKAVEAARLCKLDLTTLMIRDGKEFTGLEGVIGYYYAVEAGIDKDIAEIIREHYLPRFFGDEIPKRLESAMIGIVDRIDFIYVGFLKGFKPTGSKDPLGLRNSANGIITILINFKMNFPFDDLLEFLGDTFKDKSIIPDVKKFFNERIERYFERLGVPYDITDAVLETDINEIYSALKKAEALMKLKDKPEYERLIISQKRVANILKGIEIKGMPDENLFSDEEEKILYSEGKDVEKKISGFLKNEDYNNVLNTLLSLQKFIDNFFDKVLVMHKDEKIKENRLKLLGFIRSLFLKYADFSMIVLEGEVKNDKRDNN